MIEFNGIEFDVKDEELQELLNAAKENNLEINFINNYESEKELKDFLKTEIINMINEKYENIKSNLSDLTKSGKNVRDIRIKSYKIPLKIKLFKATSSKKDLSIIISLINQINNELKNFN